MLKIWILSSNAPYDETAIDRETIVSEGVLGGQYENIKLLDEFRKLDFDTKILNPNRITISNKSVMVDNKLEKTPDIIIVRTIHGDSSLILKSLASLNIKFINDFSAHLICANKPKQLEILSQSNINIPKTKIVDLPFEDSALEDIIFPIVIKPISSQRGELVKLCQSYDDAYIHCKDIRKRFSYQKKVIFQQYIVGPIIVVWVIGGIPIEAQIRYREDGEFFISNDRNDSLRSPYSINKKLYDIVTNSAIALNLQIAKMDIFKIHDDYMICEVNSPGGFSGRDDYFNSNHARDIALYIRGLL